MRITQRTSATSWWLPCGRLAKETPIWRWPYSSITCGGLDSRSSKQRTQTLHPRWLRQVWVFWSHFVRESVRACPDNKLTCMHLPDLVSLLAPLVRDFPSQVEVYLYHTPDLRGFLKSVMPNRYNEIVGQNQNHLTYASPIRPPLLTPDYRRSTY